MIFIGDTHGDNNYIIHYITKNNITHDNLIHVGDFGVGFYDEDKDLKRLIDLNEFLEEKRLTLHVFRGNHDNPNYFNGDYIFTNLKLHPDYTILDIEGNRILGIGGAISIDRVYRKKHNLGYWDNEVLIYDEQKIKEAKHIDILVTHTTMDFCEFINNGTTWPQVIKQFIPEDPNLTNDLLAERALMTKIWDELRVNNNIKNHFYGHFHVHREKTIGDTKHILLGINEFYEL